MYSVAAFLVSTGRLFHRRGSATLKARSPNRSRSRGTTRSLSYVQTRVQTHAGHSIAFDVFLHFVILWPLTFWSNTKWVVRTRDGPSCGKCSFRCFCSIMQTNRHTQMWMNALLPRLSSAWITTIKIWRQERKCIRSVTSNSPSARASGTGRGLFSPKGKGTPRFFGPFYVMWYVTYKS